MKKIKKSIFVFTALMALILPVCLVFAQAPPGSGELPNPLNTDTFEGLLKGILNWLVPIAYIIGIGMILYAAFLFMTSAGKEERVKQGKRALLWVLVGLAIIIIAAAGGGFVDLIKELLQVKK